MVLYKIMILSLIYLSLYIGFFYVLVVVYALVLIVAFSAFYGCGQCPYLSHDMHLLYVSFFFDFDNFNYS